MCENHTIKTLETLTGGCLSGCSLHPRPSRLIIFIVKTFPCMCLAYKSDCDRTQSRSDDSRRRFRPGCCCREATDCKNVDVSHAEDLNYHQFQRGHKRFTSSASECEIWTQSLLLVLSYDAE